MALSDSYRPRRPNVISDMIDDEVVIINLASGAYYSLDHCGSLVWQALDAGLTVGQTVERLQHRYAGEPEPMTESVALFVSQLLEEGLITDRPAEDLGAPGGLTALVTDRRPFAAPTLLKYDDMQDLIMLDPIHEVDVTGWPARKTGPGPA